MIYVDSSVALAFLFAENRQAPREFWDEALVSSRLLEFELWNRIHVRRLGRLQTAVIEEFLRRFLLIELAPDVLARALEPFTPPVRTLDGLHLATLNYVRANASRSVRLATFDARMARAARAMDFELYPF